MAYGDDAIKKRFIKEELQKTADDIRKYSGQRMASFRSAFWNNRNFTATDNIMTYSHLAQHRFVDMRTRSKDGTRVKKKSHAIHNKVVMGNYAQLVRRLSFGFTEDVKQRLRSIENQ